METQKDIATLKKMEEKKHNWISAKKRLPDSSQETYVLLEGSLNQSKAFFNVDKKMWDGIPLGKNVSHWKLVEWVK